MKAHILVAGNIGAGKSTLVQTLAEQFGWTPLFEPAAVNPYLADFYADMRRWSFHSQIFFLTHRLRIHQEAVRHPGIVIQDRSIYEDAEIFVETLYHQGHMSARDYKTYRALYETLQELIPPPDLVVYLRASVPTLLARIARRGRAYERNISPLYLEELNLRYEAWIQRFHLCPVMIIPADEVDFVTHPQWLEQIHTHLLHTLKVAPAEPVIMPVAPILPGGGDIP